MIFLRAFPSISVCKIFWGKKCIIDEIKKGMAKIFVHQECLIYLQNKAFN